MNAVQFPTAGEARKLSNKEKDTPLSLMEMAGYIRSGILAAAEAGEKYVRVTLPYELDSSLQNAITKMLRTRGYRVRMVSGVRLKDIAGEKFTTIYLWW